MRTCSVDGCGSAYRCSGFCENHYRKWRRRNSPKPDRPGRTEPIRPCSVDGCQRSYRCGGFCDLHYRRWKRHGDPGSAEALRPDHGTDPAVRFWLLADRRSDDECWLWKGHTNAKWGYATFNPSAGKAVKAHRYAYELLVGPIPDGLQIDHLCRRPSCVNPAHMEPVTPAEHNLRTHGKRNRKTHCPKGHPYDEENSYYKSARGYRTCKKCLWAAQAAYRQRRKAAAS